MKVLYDISLLGRGHHSDHFRTGIHRVVDNVARGIARSRDCEVRFCAGPSLEDVTWTMEYVRENKQFCQTPLVSYGVGSILRKKIARVLGERKTPSGRTGVQASIRQSINGARVYARYLRGLRGNRVSKLDGGSVAADLFHSPFHPFPEKGILHERTKRIITVHDVIPIIYPDLFEFKYDSAVSKVVRSLKPDDAVICNSHATRNDLCTLHPGLAPSRVYVTHLAASGLFHPCSNAEERSIAKKLQIPDGPYVLSLNTLEPRKNVAHAIRCFMRLAEQEHIPDLHLVIVGRNGWGYDDIFHELSCWPSSRERITMAGYVADEDLAALYSGALAFVYPSLYEGFGLPPLEAMKCGAPVITSNTSSLPEVVGNAGIMVSPDDADALCQGILDVYRSPSLRKAMSEKSVEQAGKFSWERTTRETIQCYKSALDC